MTDKGSHGAVQKIMPSRRNRRFSSGLSRMMTSTIHPNKGSKWKPIADAGPVVGTVSRCLPV